MFMREIEPTTHRGILATLAARAAAARVASLRPLPAQQSGGIPFAAVHRQERKAERQNRLRGRRER